MHIYTRLQKINNEKAFTRPESDYLRYFLNFYDHEIKRFFSEFSYQRSERQITLFILRDMVPAGLFIAEPQADNALFIKIDFVIPGYRDFKIGKFLFSEKAEVFKEKGVRKDYSEPGSSKHEAYLRNMGFVPEHSSSGELLQGLTITQPGQAGTKQEKAFCIRILRIVRIKI